jgi:hypothetical protein
VANWVIGQIDVQNLRSLKLTRVLISEPNLQDFISKERRYSNQNLKKLLMLWKEKKQRRISLKIM